MLMVDVTVRIYRILHGEFAYNIIVFMHELSTYHEGTTSCKHLYVAFDWTYHFSPHEKKTLFAIVVGDITFFTYEKHHMLL